MTKKRPSSAPDREDVGDARRPPQKQAKASCCTANVCFNINHYESGLHHDAECEMDVCGSRDHGAMSHKDLMDSKTHYSICDTENHHSTEHHEQATDEYDPLSPPKKRRLTESERVSTRTYPGNCEGRY